MNRYGRDGLSWGTLLGVVVLFLLVLLISPVVLDLAVRFPLEALIVVAVLAGSVLAVVLYIGELLLLGWIVDVLSEIEDFLSQIGMPKPKSESIPFEYEQVGQIIVVTLRENLVTVRQCQSLQKHLKRLLDERHYDFVLDFFHVGKISRVLRGVLVYFAKAVRIRAARSGEFYHPVAVPRRAMFRVFDNVEQAVQEMSKHEGHGWVVLCCVPAGIRAFSGLT